MGKIFNSLRDIEKTYFPKNYMLNLAKNREIEELSKYIVENNINPVKNDLIRDMKPKDIGYLLARISLEKINKKVYI